MRHSCAHLMARAVMRLFRRRAVGLRADDRQRLLLRLRSAAQAERRRFSARSRPRWPRSSRWTSRSSGSRSRAAKRRDLPRPGPDAQGRAHRDRAWPTTPTLSFYRQGEFIDLCRGPHVPGAGAIGAFKLLSVAGAYWKGDADAAAVAAALRHGLVQQGRAGRLSEDGRRGQAPRPSRAGQAARTVHHQPAGRPGPDSLAAQGGRSIRGLLENFFKRRTGRRGYEPVYTPNIGRVELYQISGHFPYYADSQFKPIEMSEDEEYLLKPMNCPHHIMIYKSKPRSYRDLPVRLAEFGTVYRYEQSGELGGMTRVRGFTQDDAHLFCTEEQVADEFRGCLEMTQFVLKALGLTDYRVRLGFAIRRATSTSAATKSGTRPKRRSRRSRGPCIPNFTIARGEAAFYGPKADFVVPDCIGREWQLGTVQLDYNLPSERFALEYIGADNQPHRPVMIHRAPLGSLERFVGVLIEHFAGAFPLWLAPEQVRVLVVSQKFEDYARRRRSPAAQGRLPRHGRLSARKDRLEDSRRPVAADPLHAGHRRPREGERHRVDPRPDRGRPRQPDVAAAIDKLQAEVAAKVVRQVAGRSPMAALAEQGGPPPNRPKTMPTEGAAACGRGQTLPGEGPDRRFSSAF